MINITNEMARVMEQARIHRAMLMFEISAQRQVHPLLGRQFLTAAQLVEQGIHDTDSAVNKTQPRFTMVMERHYKRVASAFNNDVMRLIEKGIMPRETKGAREDFWSALLPWVRKQTAEKVQDIFKTSRNQIKKIIQEGMLEGDTNAEIATRLRVVSQIANPRRARIIARNETHVAAVYAIDKSVETIRIKMEREWMSASDERVRLAHRVASGQKRGQKEPFDVGGEKLMFPGDPSGSVGNTILCRCILMYHTVKSREVGKSLIEKRG